MGLANHRVLPGELFVEGCDPCSKQAVLVLCVPDRQNPMELSMLRERVGERAALSKLTGNRFQRLDLCACELQLPVNLNERIEIVSDRASVVESGDVI